MPLYPFDPYEEVLTELDEDYTDSNNNGIWDIGEPLIDNNNNGLRDEYRPPTVPDRYHIMGTDSQGRDVLARAIYGFRISISFALIVATFSYLIGISVGATLGYFGGRLDLYGLRLIEIYASIPFLFTIMILSTFIRPSLMLLSLLLIIFGWVGITYYVRRVL